MIELPNDTESVVEELKLKQIQLQCHTKEMGKVLLSDVFTHILHKCHKI